MVFFSVFNGVLVFLAYLIGFCLRRGEHRLRRVHRARDAEIRHPRPFFPCAEIPEVAKAWTLGSQWKRVAHFLPTQRVTNAYCRSKQAPPATPEPMLRILRQVSCMGFYSVNGVFSALYSVSGVLVFFVFLVFDY